MTDFYLNPPLKEDNEEWPEQWPQWVKDALDELEHIERRFPRDLLKGAPVWVDKMSFRIIQMMHPATTYTAKTQGAAFLGSTLGHLMWLMEDENGFSAMVDRLEEAGELIDEQLRKKLTPEAYEELMDEIDRSGAVEEFERFSRSFIRLLLRKRRIIDRCIDTAKTHDPLEQAVFYSSYAEALQKPPMDETGALTKERFPNTGKIYLLLVLNWKHVISLRSGAACHAWLCAVLGERLVGTHHRIEKMASNFGINFSYRKRKKRKKKQSNRKLSC